MLKLNTNRTFTVPVPVAYVDEQGKDQNGAFGATFRILSQDEAADHPDKRLLDLVLVAVDDIELTDADGRLTGSALLAACKADPTLSTALVSRYWECAVKKPQGPT